MANYKSSEKRIRIGERNRQRNSQVKSKVKTALKRVQQAMSAKESDELASLLKKAVSELDKAQSKGVLHKNKVARKKSRLMAKINQV